MNTSDQRVGISARYFVYLNELMIKAEHYPWIMIGQYCGHLTKEEAVAYAQSTKQRIKVARILMATVKFTMQTKYVVTLDEILAVGPMYDRGPGGRRNLNFPDELRYQGCGWKKEKALELRLKLIAYFDDLKVVDDKRAAEVAKRQAQNKPSKARYDIRVPEQYELFSAYKHEGMH